MEKPGKGEKFTATIHYRNTSGNGMIRMSGGHVETGPIPTDLVGVKIEGVMVNDSRAVIESTSHEEDTQNEASESRVNESNGSGTNQTNKQATVSEMEIDTLRDRAEEASVEEVNSDVTTNSQTKPQYSRSQEVKEYVKARAEGGCEGCETSAPFKSKTGEPYLHVHHIFELSNGGSDTPDTVVALCPNCHYRVHHGQDGDEYNQELLKKVQKLEGT